VDDCWAVKNGRDSVTNQLVPDPVKFPDGIAGLADEVHALGLKFGIYGSAGTMTCAGYPGQIGFESLDASTFAAWGVDYFKYDNCFFPANWTDPFNVCLPDEGGPYPNGTCPGLTNLAPPNYDWTQSNTAHRYGIMGDALLAQNRTILYSLCEWGTAQVQLWGNATAQSWRMSGDITPDWARIATILNENTFLTQYINFWGHPDMDMLEVGNGDLTLPETRSHFAFWAALKSPIIIGTALDVLPSDHVDILKNPYLLAFNQDPIVGESVTPYKWGTNPDWSFNATNPAEYWSGASSNGTLVLALNTLATNATREILWSEVPQLEKAAKGPASFLVTDIWSGKDLGCVTEGISRVLASHDTIGFVVGEKCQPAAWW
jgi:alpha-galactosidase